MGGWGSDEKLELLAMPLHPTGRSYEACGKWEWKKSGNEVARNSTGWQADGTASHRSIEARRAFDRPAA